MENIETLTDRELEIMSVLWDMEEGLTIQEITEYLSERKLSPSSVSQAMKRLLKKKAVSVTEYRPIANVYARVFQANFSREAYIQEEIRRLEKKSSFRKHMNVTSVVAGLLQNGAGLSQEELVEIEQIIERKKQREEENKEPCRSPYHPL